MNNAFYTRLLSITAAMGAAGVIIGAFGAHFLKSRLPPESLDTIKTGVLYLFIHILALLFIISLSKSGLTTGWLRFSGIAFLAGVIMFSGSLFIIGTGLLTGFPVSTIGFVTPLGGLCFILGWLSLMIHSFKS